MMQHPSPVTRLLLVTSLVCAASCSAPARGEYPRARVSDHVDQYHGIEVSDPYRWLEETDSQETQAWIAAQDEFATDYLSVLPDRPAIKKRMTQLWNYERYGTPTQRAGRIFFTKNDGLQDQSVLYVADQNGENARVLLDPNTFSDDNTISLAGYTPSEDGKYLAYAQSDGGSDWRTWRVLEIDSGVALPDVITRNKFGGLDWAGDSAGFYYSRYDTPPEGAELQALNTPPEIAYHCLGTSPEEDSVVIARPEEEGVTQGFSLTEDRTKMIVSRRRPSTRSNDLFIVSLPATDSSPRIALGTNFDAQYQYVGDDGRTMWIETTLDAPRGKVLAVDMATAGDRDNWFTLIPESEHTLSSVSAVGHRLIVTYLVDATSRVHIFGTNGQALGEVALPGIGSVRGFRGKFKDKDTFYSFTSFTTPPTIYRYDVGMGASAVYRRPSVDFDPDDYEVSQIRYRSRDHVTSIPMFIVHKKGVQLDGNNPTYLYGYGGFNISLTPNFSVANLIWLEMGGVLAIPSLRGGGEFGEDWHEAGTKLKKQNVFDDFAWAARWLIRNDYTSSSKLAIGGGSNGGLLVGACVTQEPWLYGAAIPAVGVMDMLRYHLFTIGWAWAGDYGTSDDPEQFEALYDFSPLHNLRQGETYPATLITTAERDDRVVPAHSFKFGAAMQAAQGGEEPIIIRIETRAGHGAGKPTSKRIDEAADRWAFLCEALDFHPGKGR